MNYRRQIMPTSILPVYHELAVVLLLYSSNFAVLRTGLRADLGAPGFSEVPQGGEETDLREC